MRILCVFGRHNYGNPRRGEGYEYSNFIPALRALGHEVHHFESWNRDGHDGFESLNRTLLDTIETLRPDVIFAVLMAYEIWLETLCVIRAKGVAILNWGTDDSWKYVQFSRFVAPYVHLWATTSHAAENKARREGLLNFTLTQWAASRGRTREPLAAAKCRHQVTFVGSAYGNRAKWIEQLAKRGIQVKCFGAGWPNGPVAAEEIPTIYQQSVLSLNFGDSGLQWDGLQPYRSRQIKARIFEVPAAGGCLLTEEAEHLGDYYRPGIELATFRDADDLAAKVNALLGDPRERDSLAWAGYRRTLSDHLYEQRFQPLIEAAVANAGRQEVRSCDSFDTAAAGHRSNRWLYAISVLLFSLFWGRRRGPRAARRALFEFYWRCFGARTYSARGLPGRLFYRET